jgi:hypothetical protein
MPRRFVLAAVLALPALAGPSPALAGDLDGRQIADEIVERSLVWWETGGWHAGSLRLAADGSAELTVDRPAMAGDVGRWRILGDRLCTSWETLRASGEKCYTIRRDAEGRFVTSGGNVLEVREAGA